MTTTAAPPARAGHRPFPVRTAALLGLGGSWIAVAVAETLMSNGVDALDDVAMIAAHRGTLATAGLLHVLGGVLLGLGLTGVAAAAWSSRWSRAGWTLAATGVPCLGAIGMLHLLAVETAAAGLDTVAMNDFLVQRLGGAGGAWALPVGIAALLLPLAVVLLLTGLARAGHLGWVPMGVFTLGMLLHLVLASNELAEVSSHWLMATGLLLTAVTLWRRERADG